MRNKFPKRLVCGVGINDSQTTYKNGTQKQAYIAWNAMLNRAYSAAFHKHWPSHSECSVAKEWLHFSTFEQWFEARYKQGYQLDKDILMEGNKEYGPTTCILVPAELNMLTIRGGAGQGISKKKLKSEIKYQARCRIGGKERYLGLFKTEKEAEAAIKTAKREKLAGLRPLADSIDARLYEALERILT